MPPLRTHDENGWKRDGPLSGLIQAYSAFGFPDEAWRLFTSNIASMARRAVLDTLAQDGHVAFLSQWIITIPDSDPEKCALAEVIADGLRLSEAPDDATSFRTRYGCIRPSEPIVTFPASPEVERRPTRPLPAPPSAIDRLRKLVSLTCDGTTSINNRCSFEHAMQLGWALATAANEAQIPVALTVVSAISDSHLRARVFWTAMMFLASERKVGALGEVFATVTALANERKDDSVVSQFAVADSLIAVCLQKTIQGSRPVPTIGHFTVDPSRDDRSDCGSSPMSSMPMSVIFYVNKAGHADLAREILAWYEHTTRLAMKRSGRSGTADSVTIPTYGYDTAEIAIAYAYWGNPDIAREILRREDWADASVISLAQAYWLALLDIDDTLPVIYQTVHARSKTGWESSLFACEWLRGRVVRGDVEGVVRIATLINPPLSAVSCLAYGLWTASKSGYSTREDMAGLAFTSRLSTRATPPRAWAEYAATLLATEYGSLAERAIVAGLNEGLAFYPNEQDDRYETERNPDRYVGDVWTTPVTMLVVEMIRRGQGDTIRAMLQKAPSDSARARAVLRALDALANQGRWDDVEAIQTWADISLVRPPIAKDSWESIARRYICEGDISTALQIVHRGYVELQVSDIVQTWKNCGRKLGP